MNALTRAPADSAHSSGVLSVGRPIRDSCSLLSVSDSENERKNLSRIMSHFPLTVGIGARVVSPVVSEWFFEGVLPMKMEARGVEPLS